MFHGVLWGFTQQSSLIYYTGDIKKQCLDKDILSFNSWFNNLTYQKNHMKVTWNHHSSFLGRDKHQYLNPGTGNEQNCSTTDIIFGSISLDIAGMSTNPWYMSQLPASVAYTLLWPGKLDVVGMAVNNGGMDDHWTLVRGFIPPLNIGIIDDYGENLNSQLLGSPLLFWEYGYNRMQP